MGGSILGAKAIYNFLKHKIKKNFYLLIIFQIIKKKIKKKIIKFNYFKIWKYFRNNFKFKYFN